jgi:hypothetical protein
MSLICLKFPLGYLRRATNKLMMPTRPRSRGEGSGEPARDRCPGPGRCRAPNRCLERAPGETNADAVLADNRRCHYSGLLVPVGALSRVPMDKQCRSSHARPPSQRSGKQSHSRTVVPLMPTERAICRTSATFANEHCRRDEGRTSSSRAGRMTGSLAMFAAILRASCRMYAGRRLQSASSFRFP